MKLLDCLQISFILVIWSLVRNVVHLKLLYSNAVTLDIEALKKNLPSSHLIIIHGSILFSSQLDSPCLIYLSLSIRQVLLL